MTIDVEYKIEKWKNKLLDLGKRNRLLNYKETKRSSLQIVKPDFFSLWKSFVQDEKPLEFPFHDEFATFLFEELSYSVETNQTIREMQKTLKVLRDKAKIANEEQGINILYLSFGFLKWTDLKKTDNFFNSPIILVPVTLTVESIASPYKLSLHEDEIVINPTLRHKFENDFGLHFPDFNEEIDVRSYFESLDRIVSNNQWEISLEVSLGLLSFLKINMYNDLLLHKDKIKQSSIIRAISGDATACEKIPDELIDFDFDRLLKPTQVFQVVDADSSQQDAILCAKKGISFVLQGPPGTGKSQTITNIISECLSDGKKVLFVSEKMAALEVVHRRLSNAELDDFCLILHSHKANKRAVLDQLSNVFKMASRKVQLNEEVYQKLDALQFHKERLNDYADQINEKIQPLDKTLFEVNSILSHLGAFDEIIFSIDGIDKISREDYNRFLFCLEKFSGTLGEMTEDYVINPWNDSVVTVVTNELRHDIGANLSKLIPKVSKASQRIQQIYSELSLTWNDSYFALNNLIPVLIFAKQSPIVPVSWISGSEITPFFDEISKCEQKQAFFWLRKKELQEQYDILRKNDNSILSLGIVNLSDPVVIQNEIEIAKIVLATLPYSKWKLTNKLLFSLFGEAREKAKELNELKASILNQFENGIFDIDSQAILNRYKTEYTSFFKFFKKSYRNDKKTIQVHYKTIVKRVTDDEVLDIISKLQSHSELKKWFSRNSIELENYFGELYNEEKTDFTLIENHFNAFNALNQSQVFLNDLLGVARLFEQEENILKKHYQFLYNGIDTNWKSVRESLIWASSFRQIVEDRDLNVDFVESICSNHQVVNLCDDYSKELQLIIDDLDLELQWFISLFENKDKIKMLSMSSLSEKLERCKNNLFLLEEWIDFRNARENCKNIGLSDYIDKIYELRVDRNQIIPCFKKRFFRLWLDVVLPSFPAVFGFRRRLHENTIYEFSELDKLQFVISKAIIKSRLINNLPQLDHFTSGFDEIGILKREINKQRKIMPVRRLFKEIPNLLLTLKPCLMMSPLSVSLFLEADTYLFDTVIFDEASQVCTENAVGAIFRGKQVIIAGDSKQLPPTNFFTASTTDIEYDLDDDENDSDSFESILDEASLLPERTLRWHYRSRNEHLIAFSNAKIYRNDLITFPSSKDGIKDNGVEYIFVKEGFYDRGGRSGNVPEAKKVAELVFDHFSKMPNRSLGVIAFGEVQQQAIDTEIRSIRFRNQQFERFFNEELNEPFFIKNLENVQGDERDTIIFSIGYAKDINGIFRMNFGPLSKSGGERRLNVAITRAKFNVKLVGSIMPTDIDIDRITSEGPKLLRGYIDFAINGAKSLSKTTTEDNTGWFDSPFEEAVYKFLDQKGYRLSKQVGCSDYRIDIAVKHPTLSGIYVLGIECDGASYHSARTARERDRLRQEVLENMGWKIYRIWSTDWIKDPITEGEKLIIAISEAISTYGSKENIQLTEFDYKDPDDFMTEDTHSTNSEEKTNPYNFESYSETNFRNLPLNSFGYLEITDCVVEAINNEYPLHYDLLCQKIAPLYGNQKATIKIRREVNYALNKLDGRVFRKDDFLYPSNDAEIKVRMPNKRIINHISIDEIAVAMTKILTHCYGTTKNGLFSETRKVYGFKSSGPNISVSLNSAIDLLEKQGKVEIIDDKIRLCGG